VATAVIAFVLGAAVILSAGQAVALQKVTDSLSVGGAWWLKYTADLTTGAPHRHATDLYRGWFITDYKLNEQWSGRVVIDGRTTGTKLHLQHVKPSVYVFAAFAQGRNLALKGDVLRMGILPSFYTSRLYPLVGTRPFAMVATHEVGFVSSFNRGLSYGLELDGLSLGLQLVDGTRSHGKGTDNGLQANATIGYEVTKGAGLLLTYEYALAKANAPEQYVAAAALYYRASCLRVIAEAAVRQRKGLDREIGYGATLRVGGKRFGYFGRFVGANAALEAVQKARWIVTTGPSYGVADGLDLALAYEMRYLDGWDSSNQVVSLLASLNF